MDLPQALWNKLPHNQSHYRDSSTVYHTWVPIAEHPQSSDKIHVPVELYMRYPLLEELILTLPNHPVDVGPLIFSQNVDSSRGQIVVHFFQPIILVLLELLAWGRDKQDRHLLNIKVLCAAEEAERKGQLPSTPHLSLSPQGVLPIAPHLHPDAVQLAVETVHLLLERHVKAAARWEWRNVPDVQRRTTQAKLEVEFKNVLAELLFLFQTFPQWPAHLHPRPSAEAYGKTHPDDADLDYSAFLKEHSVGKAGRRERRRSFYRESQRDGW